MDLILIRKFLCGRNHFLPRTTHLLSLLGITIGVTALLIVSSVMNGFEQDMMRRVIGSKAEIRVVATDRNPITDYSVIVNKIEDHPSVLAVSPVINKELLAHKGQNTTVVNAFGIDYVKHNQLISLEEQIRLGRPDLTTFEEEGIIIGLDLSLSLSATIGEYIHISSPVDKVPTPFGMIPRMKRLRVLGIFTSGMPEFDKTYAYISLPNARYFSNMGDEINLLQVKTVTPRNSARYASSIQRTVGNDYLVEDWSKFDANLFQAMQLEKGVMFTVLALMLVISGFNMAGNSLKTVAEKRSEIGILKALGMKNSRINSFFVGINILLGFIGIFVGGLVSLIFIYLQKNYQLIYIPIPGFPMQWLPVVMQAGDFIVVPVIVITICLLATIIALQKIKEIEPIRIIRELD